MSAYNLILRNIIFSVTIMISDDINICCKFVFRGWQGFLAYGCQNLVTVIEPKSVQVSFAHM